MKIRKFETAVWLPLPPEQLFEFFADAGNLDALTPGWLHFKILTPLPIRMQVGTLIDYRLRVHGWPVYWRTRISAWDPPFHFVDEQLKGPYRRWVHDHQLLPENGGTRVKDCVSYSVPLDFLMHPFLVGPDINRIFDFRTAALMKHFNPGTGKIIDS